jgi:glycosyltransferase involved in cell wall biosynthesis
LRYKFESSLEAKVIRDCTYMVATTPHLAREFANRYPHFNEERFRVVFNGYDEADFTGLNGSSWPKQFEIIHAGLLSRSYRNPFGFLEVVSELLKKGLLPAALLRISFIGSGSWANSQEFHRGIERLELERIVKIEGRVSHREALERMASAAVLLLMQASDDTRALIPAKAFEYLRIGRPILSLTLPGATAELLQDEVNCFTVDPSDRQTLAAALLALHRSWSDRCVTPVVASHLDRYERRNLTRELSNVLNMAVSRTRS